MPKNPCIYTIKNKNGKIVELSYDDMRKHILDNYEQYNKELLKYKENAVSIKKSNEVDVRQQTKNGEGVGKGNTESESTTTESKPNAPNEKAQKIADFIRKGKIDKDILMSGVPFAKEVWNGAVEVMAKTVEITGDIAKAIEDGIAHIKESDWYKNLSEENKTKAENRFQQEYSEEKIAENSDKTPPINSSVDSSGIHSEQPPFTLKVAEINKVRNEFGMDELGKDKVTNLQAYKNAETTINEWKEKGTYDKNIDKIMADAKDGKISDADQNILSQHIANLRETAKGIKDVKSSEYDKVLERLKDATEAGRKIREEAGRTLGRQLPVKGVEDMDLIEYMVREMENLHVEELTDAEKIRAEKEFTEMQEIRQKLAESEAERVRLEKELAAKNLAKNTPKNTKKSKDDFIAERKSFKDELKEAKEKHEKWLKDNGISQAGASPFTLTTDMAKVIGKIIKSHAEETAIKFDDLINKVYEEVKDVLVGISKKDIIDVMAGVYNEKQETRDEKAARLRDLKTEAVLLNKLENARLQKNDNTTKSRAEKTQRIKDLEDKLKEVRSRNKEASKEDVKDFERLDEKRKRIEGQILKIQKDIKEGKFGKEEPKPPVILDKTTQLLQDRLMHLKAQQDTRAAKADYEALSKWDKGWDKFWQVLGLRRLVNAAVDFSIPFRQANTITMNPFKAKTTLKSFYNMFNMSFSPEKFKRFQYQLENSNKGKLFEHFGGVFSNPLETKMDKREEQFTNNIISTIHQKIEDSDNKGLQKVAHIADKIWFSERAAAAFLNTVRIEEFEKGSKALLQQGITPDNSPEHYKSLVKWVMNTTGRGNMIKALEDSHSGRLLANRAYFGARLMAAKINMLNPVTYKNLPKEVRYQAMKDMLGYTSSLVLTGLAVTAAGGTVSMNPDEPDFMQARFGDKVYDLTGGSAAYVRTFLRVLKGVGMQIAHPNSKASNSYTKFMGSSVVKTLVTNKLSPNTAYAYHFFTNKSGQYDDKGHLKPFDPYEIAKVYPLYVDGTIQAFKKGGVSDALMIALPDIFGIGTQQYEKKGEKTSSSNSSSGTHHRTQSSSHHSNQHRK